MNVTPKRNRKSDNPVDLEFVYSDSDVYKTESGSYFPVPHLLKLIKRDHRAVYDRFVANKVREHYNISLIFNIEFINVDNPLLFTGSAIKLIFLQDKPNKRAGKKVNSKERSNDKAD